MTLLRISLLIVVVFAAAACGGGVTGVPAPAPTATPTPPAGGFGTVTGSVGVSASAIRAGVPALPLRRTISQPTYVPDQLFVKFRSGTAAAAASDMHRQVGASVIRTLDRLDVQVVRLTPGISVEAVMAAYRASSAVEYVERVSYRYRMATPNDASYSLQWHYPQIGLPTAWDTITGAGVIVAVIDTGIRADHPDLLGITVTGFDFNSDPANGDGDGRDPDPTDPGCPNVDPTDPSHGTHVSGTIAALTNNTIGVAGVNWGGAAPTRIMALRVLGQVLPYTNPLNCGVGTDVDIADAITYAADHGAKIINMSLGGSGGSMPMDTAIAYARSRGVTLVAAAGNGGCAAISYPARNPQVIAVGATTNTNARASYSNCGPELDVVAPGGSTVAGVLSTTWSITTGSTYASLQGTSMATPHVAGVAALMYGRGITDPATIESILESTALNLGPPGFDNEFGWGLVQANAAIGGGGPSTRQCAFSGVIAGPTITRQSDMRQVTGNGTFTITNAQSGVKSVFVWQDVNGDGNVNAGDIYGETPGVPVPSGGTTSGVTVIVQTRLPASPPLSIAGGAASCF